MPMTPKPPARQADQQDVVNQMLNTAVHADAVLNELRQTVGLIAGQQPEAATDLADAATALAQVRDAMLRTADELVIRRPL